MPWWLRAKRIYFVRKPIETDLGREGNLAPVGTSTDELQGFQWIAYAISGQRQEQTEGVYLAEPFRMRHSLSVNEYALRDEIVGFSNTPYDPEIETRQSLARVLCAGK